MYRTTASLLIFLFVFLSVAFSGPALASPRAVAEKLMFNAGDVPQGSVIVHDFALKNTGSDPLTLEVKSCSCGGVKYDTPAAPIAPGKTDRIRVSIPTQYSMGELKKDILVETNDPEKKNLIFTVRGKIYPLLTIEPRVIVFGKVRRATAPSKDFALANKGKTPVVIPLIETDPPARLKASSQGKITLKPGERKVLTLTLDPGKGAGDIVGALIVKTTLEKLPEIRVKAIAEVVQ